jgi:hypothetical protein
MPHDPVRVEEARGWFARARNDQPTTAESRDALRKAEELLTLILGKLPSELAS